VARRPPWRAGRRTQDVVTWSIGVVVVLVLWFLGAVLLRHLGIG
jgi:hypothetical protein